MNKQTFQISIPQPCHEKWEEMTAVERGRFCAVCQTKVIDFTNDSDNEIIKYLQENNKVCGRLLPEQEKRSLIENRKRKTSVVFPIYKKIAATIILIAAFGEKTFAQQKKPNSSQQQVTATKKPKAPVIISGHLLDLVTQKPIINNTVFLKKDGFELQSKTNKWGGFTFSIPENEQGGKGILSFGYYQLIDEEISLIQSNTKLKLFCNEAEILNEVVIIYTRAPIIGKIVISEEKPYQSDLPNNETKIKAKRFWYRIYRITHPFKRSTKK